MEITDAPMRLTTLTARGWPGVDPKFAMRALKQMDGDVALMPFHKIFYSTYPKEVTTLKGNKFIKLLEY